MFGLRVFVLVWASLIAESITDFGNIYDIKTCSKNWQLSLYCNS